ncbi:peroxisomal biogenesis factor 11 domain-containing protein [Neospora caninum Liverpool]|uniref:Peroxisomal biogenesis factor 11 domain-containing protein n=1 Tax=Neospora caninum (strain Liverpool) TaxID=572307 RepID=F0VEA7_NEOCL|nr:peroxisomal biogenesis factor 11 domain-containing protein [Neospora caninum Liverpool]CBZ52051.1 peroxisomal biogenesis factor 11 domain-containing protein [Neospora caninum Liverpool]CEL66012.1 TPA: peroxisomal biogenesis factor 11 domain-containing protein, putative [Neospora caninum Liverpool]|eukprot:XP_003882083.1 peroxisomal biogenesis factor 11 domain-containing protein [Neospora caninum Liverpool]
MAFSNERDEVAHLVKFWSSTVKIKKYLFFITEGRDKSTKCLQYGSRTLASFLVTRNPKVAAKFAALTGTASDGRKIFRLGKFLNEYVKVKAILIAFLRSRCKSAKLPWDECHKTQLLQLISRFGFLCYWVLDNLLLLSKIKFLGFDTKKLAKLCGVFWLIGLLGSLATEARTLRRVQDDEQNHLDTLERDDTREHGANLEIRAKEAARTLRELQQEKRAASLNLIKNAADLVVASNLAHLPHKIFGHPLPEGTVGTAGFISGAISCYQLYD